MDSPPMLELDLHRRLGNFSLNLHHVRTGGGITALFGRSGAGKTSIIQMVAGLDTPDQGRIVLNERVLFDSAQKINLAPEKRRIGYVFQQGLLFPHLSVKQNLTFGMKRIPSSQRLLSFDDVVAVLDIAPLLNRRPAKLSGGEKQRVALGRALLSSPQLLLMDEPLAALDAHRKAELLPFIATLSRRFSIPILYVSHAMDEVLALADHLILLDAGQVMASGMVEEVLARPDLRSLFPAGETGTVLCAHILTHDCHYGLTKLGFSGGILLTTQVDIPVDSGVRVRIAARDVAISRSAPQQISTRNILSATVVSVSESTDHRVDVQLDCGGTLLWSQITALAQADLQLRPNDSVFALIKAVTLTRDGIAGHQETKTAKERE